MTKKIPKKKRESLDSIRSLQLNEFNDRIKKFKEDNLSNFKSKKPKNEETHFDTYMEESEELTEISEETSSVSSDLPDSSDVVDIVIQPSESDSLVDVDSDDIISLDGDDNDGDDGGNDGDDNGNDGDNDENDGDYDDNLTKPSLESRLNYRSDSSKYTKSNISKYSDNGKSESSDGPNEFQKNSLGGEFPLSLQYEIYDKNKLEDELRKEINESARKRNSDNIVKPSRKRTESIENTKQMKSVTKLPKSASPLKTNENENLIEYEDQYRTSEDFGSCLKPLKRLDSREILYYLAALDSRNMCIENTEDKFDCKQCSCLYQDFSTIRYPPLCSSCVKCCCKIEKH